MNEQPPIELRESELLLRAVYESALDAFLIADDDGFYLSANPAACALFGVAEADLLGRRMADFMAPGFDFEPAWRAFLASGRGRGEMVIIRPDGSGRNVELSAISNVLPGRHLSILRDVTDRKRAEDAVAAERPLSILLVEDHVDTAEAIADLLRERGHHVAVAGSVAAALETAAGAGIDLVISDLGLPDGSGHTLMRELKDRYGLAGIALSGYGTEEDRRESEAAGFAAHLTKPVSLDALLGEILRVATAC